MSAGAALIDMPAERGGSTPGQRAEDGPLLHAEPRMPLQSWACRQQRHETTLVSASVVGRKVRRGSPHIRPGVRLECFDQPRANILGFFYAFCQTGREGLESDESVVEHLSGMIHGRTPG
jgi:hypothetical protein